MSKVNSKGVTQTANKRAISPDEQNPGEHLRKTFEETAGYDEIVLLRNIQSHREHHLAPIVGHAWVGYVPRTRIVGISKLARAVEAFANRLQIQERLTAKSPMSSSACSSRKGWPSC
jgi:GTP cyclohydrolase I